VAAAKHVKSTAGNGNVRRWATINDAAHYLGVNPRTIRKMAATGRLTLYRNGPRLIRVDLNEVDANMAPARVS
jgi:excisionase family DNA binding protein